MWRKGVRVIKSVTLCKTENADFNANLELRYGHRML